MNAVESLNVEYSGIAKFLDENKQISLSSELSKNFTKVLVLSSASYFEKEIQDMLVDFVSNSSNNNKMLIAFLRKKAINLQYHTYFDWGKKDHPDRPGTNANVFFSLFGEEFKKECEQEILANKDLDKSIKAFLEIGHLRNYLAHSNFAAVTLDTKTAEDIFKLHKSAMGFIIYLSSKLLSERQSSD
ncbi:MAG: hypothetical protein DI539_24630 [Flavobacterium psychrophilum]|nr:MAG: hypothetical protein DI539_24630 [Flavobacterium psychrophilum]